MGAGIWDQFRRLGGGLDSGWTRAGLGLGFMPEPEGQRRLFVVGRQADLGKTLT
jgi:hypothetical protein